MTNITVAHLVSNTSPSRDRHADRVAHIIAVPANRLDRPSVIITEDGKCWIYGGEYQHFPDTIFYLEVQPAFFSNSIMKKLKRLVPQLERARAA